ILVARQHLTFFGDVGVRSEATITHLGDLLIPDRDFDHSADRPGPIGVEASRGLAGVATEHEIDADLVRLDRVERAPGEPDQDRSEYQEQTRAAGKAALARSAASRSAARGQLAERLLNSADDLFQISRRLRTRRSLAPRSGPLGAPRPAALIIRRHSNLSRARPPMQGAYIGKPMGRAKERPPQFPSQLWIAYGLCGPLRLQSGRRAWRVHADGCASVRRCCSAMSPWAGSQPDSPRPTLRSVA